MTVQTPQDVVSPASTNGLEAIFRPKSIAVLGVTNTPGTVPHDIFVNLLDTRFNGVVYPVAPRKKHIAGVRAYDYVLDIPDPVDLAILVFPGRRLRNSPQAVRRERHQGRDNHLRRLS